MGEGYDKNQRESRRTTKSGGRDDENGQPWEWAAAYFAALARCGLGQFGRQFGILGMQVGWATDQRDARNQLTKFLEPGGNVRFYNFL